jgi:hypothetical protein
MRDDAVTSGDDTAEELSQVKKITILDWNKSNHFCTFLKLYFIFFCSFWSISIIDCTQTLHFVWQTCFSKILIVNQNSFRDIIMLKIFGITFQYLFSDVNNLNYWLVLAILNFALIRSVSFYSHCCYRSGSDTFRSFTFILNTYYNVVDVIITSTT